MSRAVVNNNGKKVSRQEYNTFIKQIDISDIRVLHARLDILDYEYSPSSEDVKWRTAASYENKEKEFVVLHRYNVTVRDEGEKKARARLSVEFCVTYSSDAPMSDDLFRTFEERNLLLNTWPYFREFTHNMLIRAGWPPFIAPVFRA